MNVRVGPFIADLLWPDQALIVELDGYGAHATRSAFEADRSRDAHLTALGFRVARFTWRQLIHRRAHVASTLRTLLKARRQ